MSRGRVRPHPRKLLLHRVGLLLNLSPRWRRYVVLAQGVTDAGCRRGRFAKCSPPCIRRLWTMGRRPSAGWQPEVSRTDDGAAGVPDHGRRRVPRQGDEGQTGRCDVHPTADGGSGRVFGPQRSAEQQRMFPALLTVRHGSSAPPDAYAAAPYGNNWYWIDDRDQRIQADPFLPDGDVLPHRGRAVATRPGRDDSCEVDADRRLRPRPTS